ncbi:MAG TPA: diguanylate cyclase [Candidatus Brocadiia bacterium]|nr:diguanylate cyclase [Candidatus Brocadiia bacterium]
MARNLNENVFYKEVLDNLSEGVYIVDWERRIRFWNKAAEKITGFTSGDVVGFFCWNDILMHVDHAGENICQSQCPLAMTIEDGRPREAEIYLHHKHGHRVPVVVKTSPLKDDSGEIVGAVEIFRDNLAAVALREKIEELQGLSLLDPLTKLANKRFMVMNLTSRIDEFKRFGWPFGVLFFCIDNMKEVRDRHGRMDEILQMVARTLSQNVRSYDMVGTWGRRFLVIAKNVNEKELLELAHKLRMLVAQSGLRSESESIRVTVSVGGACARIGDEVHTILRRANETVKKCKAVGGNRAAVTSLRAAATAEKPEPDAGDEAGDEDE